MLKDDEILEDDASAEEPGAENSDTPRTASGGASRPVHTGLASLASKYATREDQDITAGDLETPEELVDAPDLALEEDESFTLADVTGDENNGVEVEVERRAPNGSADADNDEGDEDGDEPGLTKVWDADVEVDDELTKTRLESIIFMSTEPITVRKLAKILSLEGKKVRTLLEQLVEHYKDRGIVLQEISGGFQFRTHYKNAPILREVYKLKPMRMSRPALETLSIVAYRQPLTRAECEEVRGVDCGGVMKFLFEKGLVRVIGRKEEPGRPIIYGTSPSFLELFGLKSLSDLPPLHEFSELWEEHQQYVDDVAPSQQPSPPPRTPRQSAEADETPTETDDTPPVEPEAPQEERELDAQQTLELSNDSEEESETP